MNVARFRDLVFVLALTLPALHAVAGPVDDALAAYKAGEFEKGAEIAAKVPEGDPSRAKALYVSGECELARGRFAEAAAAFEGVLKLRRDSVPALTGLGRAQTARGEREAAEKTLRRAVQLDAKDVAARRALGEALLAADRADDARKELEAAWKLDPKDGLTARALVETLLRAKSEDAAEKIATQLGQTVPGSAMSWFLKGLVLDRRGKAADAIEAYEKAVAADDGFLDAHRNLAVLLTTSNDEYRDPEKIDRAAKHAAKYVELGGTDARLKELLDMIKGFMDEMRKGG